MVEQMGVDFILLMLPCRGIYCFEEVGFFGRERVWFKAVFQLVIALDVCSRYRLAPMDLGKVSKLCLK